MAIEPLGSIMSMQAQTATPVKTTAPAVEASSPEINPSTTVQEVTNVEKVHDVSQDALAKDNSQEARREASNEQIKKAVEKLNKNMSNSEAVFGIHEETNRVTIKIVDKSTKEVIKELPPEKTLDMIAKAWELAGILVDEKR